MHSLRTRITITMLCLILVILAVVTLLSAIFIRRTESHKSDQLLLMLCESGEQSLNYYFDSVQNSVLRISAFVEEDLDGLDDEQLARHMENAREYFSMMASKTKGVLTYYYRIDPSVSSTVKGFWYIDLNGDGFEEHEVTDITQYNVEDTSKLVWFTVPKHEGRPIWLAPYITDNLDVRVISYDAPVYWKGQFIGVVGIEVDYSTMAAEVNGIHPYESGYAFLSDEDGKLFYHPHMDVNELPPEKAYEIPADLVGDSTFIRYTYDGVKKIAVWRPLSNGMRLNVTVPVSETEGDWQGLILNIALSAAFVLVAASIFLMIHTRRITRPLEQLTEAAEQVDRGNYDFVLPYDGDDELGRLTRSFKTLSDNVKVHINNLNGQVFFDALTQVKNKGAFSIALEELQKQIDSGEQAPEFAVGVFDCDYLKVINDEYGHIKGDIYLKTACSTICDIFKHCPVFRIGGDEFAVIIQNADYSNLEALIDQFDQTTDDINASAGKPWEQVWISKGFAVFHPADDSTAIGVMQRADKLMYENKRDRKDHGKIGLSLPADKRADNS